MRIKLTYYDWIVLFCIGLKLSTIFATSFFMSYATTITKTSVETAVKVMEMNPVVNLIVQLTRTNLLMTVLVLPGFMFAFYFIIRNRVEKHLVQLYVYLILFSSLADLLGDLGSILGLLLNRGMI